MHNLKTVAEEMVAENLDTDHVLPRRSDNRRKRSRRWMRDVAEVKQEAEKTVLLAHRRIGQELDGIKKLGGPGRGKRIPASGKSFSEKEATGIKATSRHRLGKLLDLSPGELEATADRLHASGKDATVHAVVSGEL